MKIHSTAEGIGDIEADAVVAAVYSADVSGDAIAGPAREIDEATGGALSRLFERKEISGKRDEVKTLLAPAGVKALQVVLVGMGPSFVETREAAFQAAASAAKQLAEKPRERVAFFLGGEWTGAMNESGVCGAIVGCHGQDLYRKERKRNPFGEILWAGGPDEAVRSGQVLGECVNLTRRLVNEPPSDMNPEAFADTAAVIAREFGLEIEIWDKARLTEERCGALLAVARGSAKEPRLVIVRHQGAGSAGKTLALVGKGVTFDSGGLSIKPTEGMKTMKCDMAGAATVLGAMRAIAQLKLPLNVIGCMGLVENMLGGDAYKLGDVLHARSGKTIEVLNTDAEGRLVLADALDVAREQSAAIVDLATLTGACMVALGSDVAGVMTNNQSWCDQLIDAAEECGEPVWQLPMFEHYGELIKSEVADIKNTGNGRWGGAITAAKFLEHFVGETPWVHIDIAGPSFIEETKGWIDGGGSGAYVRTLVELARRWGG